SLPIRDAQNQSEVPHRHILAVHLAHAHLSLLVAQVRDDLMSMEIEIDPLGRGAPFRTPEQLAVETASFLEITHGKGEVETRPAHGHRPQLRASQVCSIRRRRAASGRRPRPPARLSTRCLTCVVPGTAHVTAGCESAYFNITCAQLVASISAAQSGRGWALALRSRL